MAITLNGTTGISSPGGDTSTSLATTNLSYTGTLTGGTGVIAIGTNQIYKDASGNVGIGTTSPGAKLHLTGSNVQFRMTNAAGTPTTRHIALVDSDNTWRFTRTGIADDLTIDNSGNVGIGTAGPSVKLDVNGITGWNGGTTGATAQIVGASSGVNSGGNLRVLSNTSATTDAGGSITFGGYYISTTSSVDFAQIFGAKENATSGNAAGYLSFSTRASGGNTTERARITSAGDFLVGTTSATANVVFKPSGSGVNHQVWTSASSTNAAYWTSGSGSVNGVATGVSSAACMITVNKDSGNTRSINAAGTINASGADYAEYMTKAGDFEIAKGDICGINSNGLLTNVFADAISFVVKSTDPSYVGGDSWGADIEDKDVLEIERQKVDRIAFAGQVPVNVLGAKAGDYIIPVADKKGIKGEAVSNPTFEQYQIAVGKVIAIEADGRAKIIVKVA